VYVSQIRMFLACIGDGAHRMRQRQSGASFRNSARVGRGATLLPARTRARQIRGPHEICTPRGGARTPDGGEFCGGVGNCVSFFCVILVAVCGGLMQCVAAC